MCLVFVLAGCGSRSGLALDDVPLEASVPDAAGPVDSGSRDAAVEGGAPPPLCRPGDGVVVLSDSAGADAIALDATHVYWSDVGGIFRVPKAGGARERIADGRSPFGIAVDATHVYFTNTDGSVRRARKAGGGNEVLASPVTGPRALAIDDARVYFGADGDATRTTLYAVTKDGTQRRTLGVYEGSALSLSVRGGDLFWATSSPGRVLTVPTGGGAALAVVAGETNAFGVALRGTAIYATTRGSGTGRVVAATPPPRVPRVLASGLTYPWGIAADDAWVYFGDRYDRTVSRVAVSGGAATVVARLTGNAWGLALEDGCLYVTTDAPGFVLRVATP